MESFFMRKRVYLIIAITLLFPLSILLASCNNINFKIKFIVDEHEYAIVNTAGKETISMPDNPTKDNYDFDGWFWDENIWEKPFTANSLLDQPLQSDLKVYATEKFIVNI